jgi:hypothetical protein
MNLHMLLAVGSLIHQLAIFMTLLSKRATSLVLNFKRFAESGDQQYPRSHLAVASENMAAT